MDRVTNDMTRRARRTHAEPMPPRPAHTGVPTYRQSVLPSGMTVISAPMPGATTVAATLFVGVGEAHEAPGQQGWSHLLEHLHLSHDANSDQARRRLSDIYSRGADFNAYTGQQYTKYVINVSQRYWRSIARLVAAALSSPALNTGRIAIERKVVLEEAARRQDHPNAHFYAAAAAHAFAGTPYARVGEPEHEASLGAASPASLVAWRDERYVAANTWVVVAGAIDHEEACAFASQIRLPEGPKPAEPVSSWAPDMSAPLRMANAASQQSAVVLDWPTFGDTDARSAVMGLAASFLADGTGGRLFAELRTKRGLTYDPAVQHLQYPDAGALEVWFESSNPELADAALETAIECVTNDWKLIDEPVLRRLQRQAVGRYDLAAADPAFLVSFLGDVFASLGRIHQPDYVARRLRVVTVSEIQDLWREYLRPERVIITRQN